DHLFSLLQRDTVKLQGNIEQLRSELKYDIEKVILVLRDELANQKAENNSLTRKLEEENNARKAQVDAGREQSTYLSFVLLSIVGIDALFRNLGS
ncbi:hypothetical protein SOVF_204030, partial [Spinacia oleracea]